MSATSEQDKAFLDSVELEIAGARHSAALSLLNRSASDSPAASLLRAKALYGLERFDAAMNELQSLLEKKLEPAMHVRVRVTKLHLMGVMARTEEVVSYALDVAAEAKAEGMTPEAVDAHTDAAWQYGRMRCQPVAEEEIATARKLAATHPKAAILNADIDLIEAFVAMQFDDRPRAMATYLRAAQVRGDAPEVGRIRRAAHVGIARIHYLLGEFDQAHRALDALRPFAESDLRSRRMVIQVLAAQKRWAEVALVYSELRAASPKSTNAESDDLDRALALYRAGNFDDAVAGFAKVVGDADDFKDERVADARTTLRNLMRAGARDMKRKRLYAFPSVAQLRNHCGPASCELYLRFFGISAEQIEIARAIKFPDGGTPVYRMRQYLEQAGFVARRIEAELPRLRALLDRDIPVILEEDYSSSRHVAVAIGYDDARGILEVQDPMTHAVRETTYEELAKIQAFSNAGALVAVPRSRPDLLAALDQAGALDCEYISLVDRAWTLYDEEKFAEGDLFVQNALSLRRDYELAWIYQFQRAMKEVERTPTAETRVRLHRIVAEAEAIWPNEEWPQTLRGDVAYSEDRYGEALAAFERARDRDPDDPSNWSKIADCQLALGNTDAAKSALVSCLARDPAHPRGTENLSYIYAEQEEFGRAAMLNEVALTKRPNNPFNWGVKRTINLGRRRYAEAVKDWEKIRELDPPRADRMLLSHVRILCKLRRFDEAERLLREGAGTSGDHKLDCLTELGYVFYKAGEWSKAIAAAGQLEIEDKGGCVAPAQRGAAKLGAGDFEGGMADLDEALRRFPALSWALHKKGKALIGKDTQRAIGSISAACILSPGIGEYELDLGMALEAARCSAAGSHLRKAAESGDLSEAQLTRIGDLLVSLDGGRNADRFFDKLEDRFPNDIGLRRAHAKMLLESLWMPSGGLDVLRSIGRIAPNDPFGKLGIGISKMGLGVENEEEGKALARQAIAELDADPATTKLLFPRQIFAQHLATLAEHDVVLDVLQKSPGDYIDSRLRVAALAAMQRFDEAEAHIVTFEQKYGKDGKPSPSGPLLRYKIADAKKDFAQGLAIAQAAGKVQGERADDGRLDDWEVEQFKCLLGLGRVDEALAFGLAQAGDGVSVGRLAYAALAMRAIQVAQKLAEDTLRLDPNEAYGWFVLGRVAELGGDMALAHRHYDRARETAPGWHASTEELARLALANGDLKTAETHLAYAFKKQGHTCFGAVGLMTETHLLAGRVDEARALAQRARRFGASLRHANEDVHGILALLERRPDIASQWFDVFLKKPGAASAADRQRIDRVWSLRQHL